MTTCGICGSSDHDAYETTCPPGMARPVVTDEDRAWAAVAATLMHKRGMTEDKAVAQVKEWRTQVAPVVDPAIRLEFIDQVHEDLRRLA